MPTVEISVSSAVGSSRKGFHGQWRFFNQIFKILCINLCIHGTSTNWRAIWVQLLRSELVIKQEGECRARSCMLCILALPLWTQMSVEREAGKAWAWPRQAECGHCFLQGQGEAMTWANPTQSHQGQYCSSSFILSYILNGKLCPDMIKAPGRGRASSPAKWFSLFDIKTQVEKESKEENSKEVVFQRMHSLIWHPFKCTSVLRISKNISHPTPSEENSVSSGVLGSRGHSSLTETASGDQQGILKTALAWEPCLRLSFRLWSGHSRHP